MNLPLIAVWKTLAAAAIVIVLASRVVIAEPQDDYIQGISDWQSQKAWFDSQTGHRRAGADYWATNRNVSGHASCGEAADRYESDSSTDKAAFATGCWEAKRLLDPIDAKRRSNPRYRAGFSDEAKQLTAEAQKFGSLRLPTTDEIILGDIGKGSPQPEVEIKPSTDKTTVRREITGGDCPAPHDDYRKLTKQGMRAAGIGIIYRYRFNFCTGDKLEVAGRLVVHPDEPAGAITIFGTGVYGPDMWLIVDLSNLSNEQIDYLRHNCQDDLPCTAHFKITPRFFEATKLERKPNEWVKYEKGGQEMYCEKAGMFTGCRSSTINEHGVATLDEWN